MDDISGMKSFSNNIAKRSSIRSGFSSRGAFALIFPQTFSNPCRLRFMFAVFCLGTPGMVKNELDFSQMF